MEENRKKVEENAKKIIENGKGILAADESPDSIKKRFDLCGIENSEENRRKFRNIMLTTEGIEKMIGGVILHEETFEQKADNGKLFVDLLADKGIAPGIKLDLGLKDFCDNEKICLGIEDLDERLKKESFRKAIFAKWRCVFSVSKGQPSMKCIDANCEILARYSEICQKHGIVPIVEPELLWDGSHTIEEATLATTTILSNLVVHLNQRNVHLPGVLLKMAFVTAGKEKGSDFDYEQVANVTYHCIRSNIPQTIAGVVFLSGGHTKEDSTVFLDKINKAKRESYILTFSYGRALSDVVLSEWKADDKNIDNAVKAFKARVSETYKASQGQYR